MNKYISIVLILIMTAIITMRKKAARLLVKVILVSEASILIIGLVVYCKGQSVEILTYISIILLGMLLITGVNVISKKQ